jgi:hypothetical protein
MSENMTKTGWRILRPFPNAHWVLPVTVVVVCEALVFGHPCQALPANLGLAALCSILFMSLWIADLRRGAVVGRKRAWKVAGQAMRDLLILLMLVIVAGLPMIITIPAYQCYSDRAMISERLLQLEPARTEIEKRARKAETVENSGVGLHVDLDRPGDIGLVASNGTIVFAVQEPTAVAILSPSYAKGDVAWRCVGLPAKRMPAICRQSPPP